MGMVGGRMTDVVKEGVSHFDLGTSRSQMLEVKKFLG